MCVCAGACYYFDCDRCCCLPNEMLVVGLIAFKIRYIVSYMFYSIFEIGAFAFDYYKNAEEYFS